VAPCHWRTSGPIKLASDKPGPRPREERPFDLAEARQQFADANAAWAADDGA
jgi:hypothetical protein